jgi:RecB family endonuclease NucS
MQLIAARLSARYSGRIEAELSLGDAILLIRDYQSGGDGSVALYGARGLQPRNWMPAGARHERTASGYRFSLSRGSLNEVLEVYIETVHGSLELVPQLDPVLVKLGGEREFADLLAAGLGRIEPGLEPLGREVRTAAGPIDIMARDGERRPVIIEVKRRQATLADLYQWRRYRDAIQADREWGRMHPRGLIIAPAATRELLAALDAEPRLVFVRLRYEDLVQP